MRIDLYTKIVLTAIALCLVYLCVGRSEVVPAVEAQVSDRSQPTRVVISGWVDAEGRERQLPKSVVSAPGPRPLPVLVVEGVTAK
jgi:hypothetical protein